MHFEFATATRIIFGAGTIKDIGPLAAQMGWRALVVTGVGLQKVQPTLEMLAASGVLPTLFAVSGEPTTEIVRQGVTLAQENDCDMVIGFGGGSALDTGKAIAALRTNLGDIYDYLEVIGRGQALDQPPVPYIAIPTTAGTGTEVTKNAVLSVPEHRVKVSLRSPAMLPKLALVDPELTYSLPPDITASTGMDALTQVLEPFVSIGANPLIDAICREGMLRAARSIQLAYQNGNDQEAREDLSFASLLGGMALANAKLGAVHGFAGPLGGMFSAPHGAICACLLPQVMDVNVRALQARAPDSRVLMRYDEAAKIITAHPNAGAADAVAWVKNLCEVLQVPPLSEYGLTEDDFPTVVAKAAQASSMKGNPIELTQDELEQVLNQAL